MKKLALMLVLAVLMSACVKPETEKKRFSILGDSYSTYSDAVDPETNDVFPYDNIGLAGVEQMWWHIMARETGWLLEKNNSFSGSLMCNYDYVNYYGTHSYLRRMNNLGNPDVIFVFGATNDACAHDDENNQVVPLGNYVYSLWTEEELCTFRPAFACIFDGLKRLYPSAELYFMLDMNLGSGGISAERRDAFIESIHRILNHYGVKCIDLEGIQKSHWHPDVEGQQTIARQVIEALEMDFNV